MKRLILTGWSDGGLAQSGLADIVISFHFRFNWGPLPSPEMLSAYFSPYTDGSWSGRSLVGLGRPLGHGARGAQTFVPGRFRRFL